MCFREANMVCTIFSYAPSTLCRISEHVRADELALYTPNIDRKIFNKVSHSVAFLAGQLCLFYGLDLFSLHRRILSISTVVKTHSMTYDMSFEKTFQPCVLFVQEI